MDECRSKFRILLTDILSDPGNETSSMFANALEVSAFNACIRTAMYKRIPRYWENCDFRRLYTAKARSHIFNLKDPQNTALRQKVLNGTIPPKTLANLTSQQMNPELWEDSLHKKMIRDVEQDPTDTPEGIVQCKKCGSHRVQWQLKQCRSAGKLDLSHVLADVYLNLCLTVCVCV